MDRENLITLSIEQLNRYNEETDIQIKEYLFGQVIAISKVIDNMDSLDKIDMIFWLIDKKLECKLMMLKNKTMYIQGCYNTYNSILEQVKREW